MKNVYKYLNILEISLKLNSSQVKINLCFRLENGLDLIQVKVIFD